jgi:hypothetical protein
MEFVVTARRPFEEIEAQTIDALEQQGFVVRCTFSLRSATGSGSSSAGRNPGYSVLLLYASGLEQKPLGLVTLYERGEKTVIRPGQVLAPAASGGQDAGADLVAALVQAGFDLSMDAVDGAEPIDPGQIARDAEGEP